jgi:RNA polymerase sigma-70 factor, ECF subfamily
MSHPDELTSLALDAREGDRFALAAFVKASEADVWRLCARLVDRQSADDLTQEVYVRAMRALPAFEARSTARTWLLSIARRTCADEVRRRVRRRRLLGRIGARRGDDEAVEPDVADASAVEELLSRLAPDRREAFVLTQVVGLSYAEAAEVCACPVGTIRSRVARARADLVAALGGAGLGRCADEPPPG